MVRTSDSGSDCEAQCHFSSSSLIDVSIGPCFLSKVVCQVICNFFIGNVLIVVRSTLKLSLIHST